MDAFGVHKTQTRLLKELRIMGNKDLDHFVWQHFTPFSIGFDETFQRLEAIAGAGTSYPPYNVINGPDGRTSLEIALAGFSGDDIEVTTERNVLTVRAYPVKEDNNDYKHKGIASRSFTRSWQLGADVEVDNVAFENGLLTIDLQKHIPEAQKHKLWFGKELKKLDASAS